MHNLEYKDVLYSIYFSECIVCIVEISAVYCYAYLETFPF